MVDLQTVCCMCGDVGFPDKLFRCNKCRNRFQHLYCSNYYSEYAEPIELCDWCRSEERSPRHGGGSLKKSVVVGRGGETGVSSRSEYSGEKIKQQADHHREESSSGSGSEKTNNKNQPSSGVPSPRTATRRYKLLKDVMC